MISFRIDGKSGVPVYRQLIDQVMASRAAGVLLEGDQLPTVRQAAVNLSINLNTVARAYRELEIRGVLTTQQGVGTFISGKKIKLNEIERQRKLSQVASEFLSRAAAEGFTLGELIDHLRDLEPEEKRT
jgi:GntR family transcriptional regulator